MTPHFKIVDMFAGMNQIDSTGNVKGSETVTMEMNLLLLWFLPDFSLHSDICNGPVNFSPNRGKVENKIRGIDSQGFAIVKNIWQMSLLRALHLTLFSLFYLYF